MAKVVEPRVLGNGNVAFQRIGAGAGIIGPILFAVLVAVESLLRPGYSQVYDDISYLGIGPFAIIQNANFIIFGLLLLVFAIGFGRTVQHSSGRGARGVAGILVVSGLGVIFAGVSLLFLAYFAHILATFIAFGAIIAAQLLTWRSLRNTDGKTWGRYRAFSLLKRWSLGTYHGLRRKHVDTYLNEFVFRYNRRFYRHVSFETLLGLAADKEPASYWDIIKRENPRKSAARSGATKPQHIDAPESAG